MHFSVTLASIAHLPLKATSQTPPTILKMTIFPSWTWIPLRLMLALGPIVATSPAIAASDGPMRFEVFQPCSGNASFCAPRILARGVIQPDSADELAKFLSREAARDKYFNPSPTIVFDSPGGNLLGGIALGRLIRSRKLDTLLAPGYAEELRDNTLPEGYRVRVVAKEVVCASACTLAFIGGSVRALEEDAMLGVHQFSTATGAMNESASQVTVTALASYVTEMGVDRRMIDVASVTSSKEIFWISAADARQLRIDNTVPPLNDWEVTVDKVGVPTVQVLQQLGAGRNVLIFLRTEPQGAVKLTVVSSFARDKVNTERLKDFPVGELPAIHAIVNGQQEVKLRSTEPWRINLDKSKGLTLFIATALLTAGDVEAFRIATTLKIHDDFANSILDMSLKTQLSTKNLAGGIGLLLRSR